MFKNFLKGMGIGVANIIPGVSGGTLAVVFGIYDKLMEAVAEFLTAPKDKKIEYAKFLVQIGLGAIIGILVFARVIEFLLQIILCRQKLLLLFLFCRQFL